MMNCLFPAIFILVSCLILGSSGFALEASASGNLVTVTGTAPAGDQVTLRSIFTMDLPVTAGEYQYETVVQVPQKPNRFTLTARNIADLNAGVKFGIWITKGFQVKGGTVSISQADVPPGRYNIKIFGLALPGSKSVPVNVEAQTAVLADSDGKYRLEIDASGIPAGDYRIEAAGETRLIHLSGSSSSSAALAINKGEEDGDASGSDTLPGKQPANGLEITPRVVMWYANQIGLDANDSGKYNVAEMLLYKRLSQGYWKIIARNEPLTEEAGNCKQEFCLVRGVDACTACKEKDMLMKKNQSQTESIINESSPQSDEPATSKGFMNMITDWLGRYF